MKCFRTRGVNIIHRLDIQDEPLDGCSGPVDQFFNFFLKKGGIGEIE